jgi:DNA-binding transcriptional ArsR family regulator
MPQETKYKVQSLERGLAILRELRTANGPVRNQELVARTQLPKATVSRLLSTLSELGYVRRIDQGSYVLAHASSRTGQNMLSGLGLAQYGHLFVDAPGPVYLEAWMAGGFVPVYRWAGHCAGPIANGGSPPAGSAERAEQGSHWDADTETWCAWSALPRSGVGRFALKLQVAAPSPPAAERLAAAHQLLDAAMRSMLLDTST